MLHIVLQLRQHLQLTLHLCLVHVLNDVKLRDEDNRCVGTLLHGEDMQVVEGSRQAVDTHEADSHLEADSHQEADMQKVDILQEEGMAVDMSAVDIHQEEGSHHKDHGVPQCIP